jgi:predicted PurR-regulated permease PerM
MDAAAREEHPAPTGGGSSRRWRPPGWVSGRALPIAVGVTIGLLAAEGAAAVLGRIQWLLVIVLVSLFLSFAMEPAVQWMARRGVRRGVGTWLVFLATLLFFGGFMAAMAVLVIDQARNLIEAGPALLSEVADRTAGLLPSDVAEPLNEWMDEQQRTLPDRMAAAAGALGRGALGLGQTLVGGLFQMATVALVTFYLVADGPRLRLRLASRLEPHDQIRVLGLWELAITKTGGYVYSRVLTAVASAAFHVAVFSIVGVEYAIVLGIWVGIVSSLIPAIGTYLAGALPLVVALADSVGQALIVLVAIILYQQVENYWVVPRITATTLELHPAVAFLSVLAGGAVAGATGALLAIPAVAIATALISAAGEEFDVLEHHLLEVRPSETGSLVAEVAAADRRHQLRRAADRERAVRAAGPAPSDEPRTSGSGRAKGTSDPAAAADPGGADESSGPAGPPP